MDDIINGLQDKIKLLNINYQIMFKNVILNNYLIKKILNIYIYIYIYISSLKPNTYLFIKNRKHSSYVLESMYTK